MQAAEASDPNSYSKPVVLEFCQQTILIAGPEIGAYSQANDERSRHMISCNSPHDRIT